MISYFEDIKRGNLFKRAIVNQQSIKVKGTEHNYLPK
jgi:hypothetical protein